MAFNFGDTTWSSDEEESEEYAEDYNRLEASTHSTFSYQCGRVTVGSHEGDAESMRVDVEYDRPFPDDVTPMVFCQMEGEDGTDWDDVFGCTIVATSNEGFSVNVGRGGPEKSWGQQIGLNWIAVEASNNPMICCMQVDAGACDEGGTVHVDVQFPLPLSKGQRPFMLATCFGEDYPDSFAVTLKKITRHRASFNVARILEHGSTWGQNVRLNVCYFMQGLFPTFRIDVGSSEENHIKIEGIEWGAPLRRQPIPFVMIQHPPETGPGYMDSFISSITNITKHDFQLNVMRCDSDGGWGMEARALVALIL